MKTKFLLSENLNRLAKWLRLLGYDAVIYKSISLHKKIQLAQKERRIFLTRSKKIAKNSIQFSRRLIKSDDHLVQLKELENLINYDENMIFTRCIECNKLLNSIEKDKIKNRLDEFTFQNFEKFKICRKCGKIYWEGSHYQNMKNILKRIIDK